MRCPLLGSYLLSTKGEALRLVQLAPSGVDPVVAKANIQARYSENILLLDHPLPQKK